MIYSEKKNATEKSFVELLERSRKVMLSETRSITVSSTDFENIVLDSMRMAAKGTEFADTIRRSGPNSFPDIIANGYFGVEVKMTIKDQWVSIGNSVLESSRIEDVERIYIMFGKFGGKFDVRYRLYQECLPEVSVTHYPRYKIDMELALGKSIFDKIGVSYEKLRKDDKAIDRIRSYYRSQLKDGESLWWIEQGGEERIISPVIKQFRSLNKEVKQDFVTRSFILFPEIFTASTKKFERPAAFMISEYNAVSTNIRDAFTAGGKVKIRMNNKIILVPKIFYKLYIYLADIQKKIDDFDEETLRFYWKVDVINRDRLKQWKGILSEIPSSDVHGISISDIFEGKISWEK